MTLEEIKKYVITQIGRENVDKFVENENGDLVGIETISVDALVEDIYNKSRKGLQYELAVRNKALQLCILENNDQEDIFEIMNIQEYYIDQARKELKGESDD